MKRSSSAVGQERPSIGNHLYGAFGRDFATADGKRIMVAAISAGQWAVLVRACGIQGAIEQLQRRMGLNFDDEAQRYEARDAIAVLVELWFAAHTHAELARILDEQRVCWGTYRAAGEALQSDDSTTQARHHGSA